MKKTSNIPENYNLLNSIKEDKYYERSVRDRTRAKHALLERNLKTTSIKKAYLGQVCYFKYFEPKTKEDLEYYDAKPVILVFSRFNTEKGEPRILGFNVHYYPPKMRYLVMDKIFQIYKPLFEKGWKNGLTSDNQDIDYQELLEEIKRAKLEFGVREYIPGLIRDFRVIPTEFLQQAIMTEGMFKKRTREAIVRYWENYKG